MAVTWPAGHGPIITGSFFTLDLSRKHYHVLTLDTRENDPTDAQWETLQASFRQAYALRKRFLWIIDMRHFNLDVFAARIADVYNTVHPLRQWSGWLCAGTVLLTDAGTCDILDALLRQVPTRSQLEVVCTCADLTEVAVRMARSHIYLEPRNPAAPQQLPGFGEKVLGAARAVVRMRGAPDLPSALRPPPPRK